MKKSTALKLVFALLLVCTSLVATVRPVHALNCSRTFLGCNFIEVRDLGGAYCCMYLCPDGREKRGLCQVA